MTPAMFQLERAATVERLAERAARRLPLFGTDDTPAPPDPARPACVACGKLAEWGKGGVLVRGWRSIRWRGNRRKADVECPDCRRARR